MEKFNFSIEEVKQNTVNLHESLAKYTFSLLGKVDNLTLARGALSLAAVLYEKAGYDYVAIIDDVLHIIKHEDEINAKAEKLDSVISDPSPSSKGDT